MIPQTSIKGAECARRTAAEDALEGLSEKDKVYFALALLMRVREPAAMDALRFTGKMATDLADALIRDPDKRECA